MNASSLDALRDIHLPPMPSLWLAAALLAAVAVFAIAWFAWRRRRRGLRLALREVTELAARHARDRDAGNLARGLSGLLRRQAMARFPQERVAGLSGAAWLDFLDAHGGAGAFRHGPGAVLETLPYRLDGEVDAPALLELARRWLKANPR